MHQAYCVKDRSSVKYGLRILSPEVGGGVKFKRNVLCIDGQIAVLLTKAALAVALRG